MPSEVDITHAEAFGIRICSVPDFGLLREDFPDDELDEDEMNSHVYDCPASVMMRSAKIPLAGLYHPPGLSRTKTFADYD